MSEKIINGTPEITTLPNAYECVGASYTENNSLVEIYRLRGHEEHDELSYLARLALDDGRSSIHPSPEYEVHITDAQSAQREIWQVTHVRDPAGWFTPSDEKYFSLHRDLETPNPATSLNFEHGLLQWTHQARVLLLSNRGYYNLSDKAAHEASEVA